MAKFDETKISNTLIEAIEVAGHLEQEEFEASIRLAARKAHAAAEHAETPAHPTTLPALQIQLEPKRNTFNLEAAQQFLESGFLSWGHSPKEFLNWIVEALSEDNKSVSELHFDLQEEGPPLSINYSNLVNTIATLTYAGILHTDSRPDQSGRGTYPTEVYFVNFGQEAQKFILGLSADTAKESVESKINAEALADLENLLNRVSLSFDGQTGLRGFLQQFQNSSGEPVGPGTLLKKLNDFSLSTRSLIESAIGCASIAGILEIDKNGLCKLNHNGLQLLEA